MGPSLPTFSTSKLFGCDLNETMRHGDVVDGIFCVEDEFTMKDVKPGHAEELGLMPLGHL